MDNYLTEQRALSLLEDLKHANERVKEVYRLTPTTVLQDAAIQRFEFTFELSWKLMQEMSTYLGKPGMGPAVSIRTAAEKLLIDDPEAWMDFLKARNLTSHTYKQPLAKEIYEKVKSFPALVDQLIASTEHLLIPKS